MRAVSVERKTEVGKVRLSIGMVHLNHHRQLYWVCTGDCGDVSTRELIRLIDGVSRPIRPVDLVQKHGDAEWMPEVHGGVEDCPGPGAVQVGIAYGVQLCVDPVKFVESEVYA